MSNVNDKQHFAHLEDCDDYPDECIAPDITLQDVYPITIVYDRYGGSYSGAEWVAYECDPEEVPEEVNGNDTVCSRFWETTTIVVGLGNTPTAAWINLHLKVRARGYDSADKRLAEYYANGKEIPPLNQYVDQDLLNVCKKREE